MKTVIALLISVAALEAQPPLLSVTKSEGAKKQVTVAVKNEHTAAVTAFKVTPTTPVPGILLTKGQAYVGPSGMMEWLTVDLLASSGVTLEPGGSYAVFAPMAQSSDMSVTFVLYADGAFRGDPGELTKILDSRRAVLSAVGDVREAVRQASTAKDRKGAEKVLRDFKPGPSPRGLSFYLLKQIAEESLNKQPKKFSGLDWMRATEEVLTRVETALKEAKPAL